jgi:hypothetical protein
MSALGEGDAFFLQELEVDVRAELTIAETQPEEEADGEPDVMMLLDPDAERYEVALRSLLGAVEAVEDAPTAWPPNTGQAAPHRAARE